MSKPEIMIVESTRGFERGFTVERVESGRVTGCTQQWPSRGAAAACIEHPDYWWLHVSEANETVSLF